MKRITYQKPDLHMHSVYSDGTDTPELLLRNVRAAGLDIFALTDHDTAEGCDAVRALLQPDDPVFIGGVEFSCKDARGKYHMLGYCYDVKKPAIRETVAFAHNNRILKTQDRFRYLQERFGFTFTGEERAELLASIDHPDFREDLIAAAEDQKIWRRSNKR